MTTGAQPCKHTESLRWGGMLVLVGLPIFFWLRRMTRPWPPTTP